MARPAEFPVKKLIAITPEVAKAIEDYRFDKRLKTEAEAMRRLIEAGLRAEKAAPSSSSNSDPSGSSKPSTKPVPRPRKPAASSRKAEPAAPRSKLDQIRAMREQGAR
jgi:hypothetical protein